LGKRINGSSFDIAQLPELQQLVEDYSGQGMRIVLRPSGTEPLLRITIEGEEEQVSQALEAIVPLVERIFKGD